VARTQLYLELGPHVVHQLRGRQLLILALALVEPLPQRGMGLNGMAIPPIDQGLPGTAPSLVLDLPSGQLLGVNCQVQFSTHLRQRFAWLDALEQLLQALGLLDHGGWVIHGHTSYSHEWLNGP